MDAITTSHLIIENTIATISKSMNEVFIIIKSLKLDANQTHGIDLTFQE